MFSARQLAVALGLKTSKGTDKAVPCLVGCLSLAFPRLALVLVWFFGGSYVVRPYGHWLWPLLGLLFLPLTTLTFAFAYNSLGTQGVVSPFGWLLTAFALLADLGIIGGSHRGWRDRRGRRLLD
jgi:hypothetical protein